MAFGLTPVSEHIQRRFFSATSVSGIGRVFAAKGEKIVEMNQKAFDIGLNAVKNW